MVQLQLVCLDPLCQIVRRHAPVAQGGGGVHKQAISGRGAERVDNVYFAVGIALMQSLRQLKAVDARLQRLVVGLRLLPACLQLFGFHIVQLLHIVGHGL